MRSFECPTVKISGMVFDINLNELMVLIPQDRTDLG